MIVTKMSTRKYGKLFKELVGIIKPTESDFDGTIEVTRLRKYDDSLMYHGGEVDIIYRGTILAHNGRHYHPTSYGRGKIRSFCRREFHDEISLYTRPFGIDNVKICKITFE